jgi:two-component system cell cycle sensor histidine kinase/response regulator CckA
LPTNLKSLGYSVDTRADGRNALALFTSKPDEFDLVITDNTMPKMNGMELAKRLHQIRPNLPVILVTGFSEQMSRDEAKAKGFADLLLKPILNYNLAVAVRKALDESAAGVKP